MKILGIESSCDDTSIAIIDSNKNIISNEVFSQTEIHKEFNGIVPELAARNHIIHIDRVLKKCLTRFLVMTPRICTKFDGNCSQESPGAF